MERIFERRSPSDSSRLLIESGLAGRGWRWLGAGIPDGAVGSVGIHFWGKVGGARGASAVGAQTMSGGRVERFEKAPKIVSKCSVLKSSILKLRERIELRKESSR